MIVRLVIILTGVVSLSSFGKVSKAGLSYHFLVRHGEKSTSINVRKAKKKVILQVTQGSQQKRRTLSLRNFKYIGEAIKNLKPSKRKAPCARSRIEVRVRGSQQTPKIHACLSEKTKSRHALVKLVNLLSSL